MSMINRPQEVEQVVMIESYNCQWKNLVQKAKGKRVIELSLKRYNSTIFLKWHEIKLIGKSDIQEG